MTQNSLLVAACASLQEVHVDSFIHTVTLPAPFKRRTRKSCSSHRASLLRMACFIFSCRGHSNLFETWFLLVQCAHWVEAALRLLPTSSPENCRPLLWLLTFFYHPTNRGHRRASLMVSSAWGRVFQTMENVESPSSADSDTSHQPTLHIDQSSRQMLKCHFLFNENGDPGSVGPHAAT